MGVIFGGTRDFKTKEKNITQYKGKVKKKLTWVGEMNLQGRWKDGTLGNVPQTQIRDIK